MFKILMTLSFMFLMSTHAISADDAKMKAWKEAATVGAGHSIFKNAVGNWTYSSKWWEPGKDKPQESSGKSKFVLVLGGRYLQQNLTGKAMGEKFEGMGFLGYDNVLTTYDVIWMDTMGTGILRGVGSYDDDTHILTEKGSFSDPTSATKTRNYIGAWQFVDKDNMTYTMTSGEKGKDETKMEIVYKRSK